MKQPRGVEKASRSTNRKLGRNERVNSPHLHICHIAYTLYAPLPLARPIEPSPIYNLQHAPGKALHRLSDAQIGQNLLGSSQNGVKLVGPMKLLHDLAHARLGQAPAAKDIDRLVRNLVCRARREGFQESNRPAQVLSLLSVRHHAHLMRNLFEPGLVRLAVADHLGELLANRRLVNQLFPKHDSLVGPFHALFRDSPALADDRAGHHPALVVEVVHHHLHALAVDAEEVAHRDTHVLKGDVGGAGSGGVGGFDGLRLDAFGPLNHERGEAFGGAAGRDKVVAEGTIGDPLLGAVDGVVLSVVTEGGSCPEARNLWTR
jgi:hypothetical protein